jgi:hypothetical protein
MNYLSRISSATTQKAVWLMSGDGGDFLRRGLGFLAGSRFFATSSRLLRLSRSETASV